MRAARRRRATGCCWSQSQRTSGIHDASCTFGWMYDVSSSDWSHTMTTVVAPADLSQFTGAYTIAPAHSQIGFVARHAMVTKVRGAFDDFDGAAVFDAANPEAAKVTVNIRANSINTRNAQRDEHLR